MSTEPAAGDTHDSPALSELADVARLRAERDHLTVRHAAVTQDVEHLEDRVRVAAEQLDKERKDVEALESMSLTRVLSAIRGRRWDDLDRERQEVRAAEYTYATEHARLKDALVEQATLARRLNDLGMLEPRWQAALDAREAELCVGSPEGARLAEIAEQVARATVDRKETAEALEACVHAGRALGLVAMKLGTAGNWATYDTFFGGGLMADMVKHRRLDEAAALIQDADRALHHLSAELADVGVAPLGELGVGDLAKVFDVWFDNIFSDWSVANRIRAAQMRVASTRRVLGELDGRLRQQVEDTDQELARLAAEREQRLQV